MHETTPTPILLPGSVPSASAADPAGTDAAPQTGEPTDVTIIRTLFGPDEIQRRLDALARRGKLPGFSLPTEQRGAAGHVPIFTVSDFGQPFESRLTGVLEPPTPAGEHAGQTGRTRSRLRLERSLRPIAPWIFGVTLVLTVWPGLPLTDSLLATYFPSLTIPTWWWYLPLTVPTAPWAMWAAIRKSRAAGRDEARKLIATIATELDGTVEARDASPK
jgi:hypothetical protein